MFRNLFFAAILAALCAGLVASVLQQARVVPLILQAETYEGEAAPHEHAPGTPAHEHHEHGADEWAPRDGFERTAYTVLANLLMAAGFALVVGAVSLVANLPITLGNGAVWGLGGFLAFSLAPAYGLAPELPGMPAGDLLARQLWWAGTALATGAALILLAKTRAAWALLAAALLIAAPHLVGAPQPESHESAVPAFLAANFAANALGTAAVFWVVLGAAFGRFNEYFAQGKGRS